MREVVMVEVEVQVEVEMKEEEEEGARLQCEQHVLSSRGADAIVRKVQQLQRGGQGDERGEGLGIVAQRVCTQPQPRHPSLGAREGAGVAERG